MVTVIFTGPRKSDTLGHAAREEGVNAIYKAIRDIEWIRNERLPKVSDFLGPVKMTVTPSSRAACPDLPCATQSTTIKPFSAMAMFMPVGSPTMAKSK